MPKFTLVFDRTGSMSEELEYLKKYFVQYVSTQIADGKIDLLELVTFDDHYKDSTVYNDDYYWESKEMRTVSPNIAFSNHGETDNLEQFMYWLSTVQMGYGADTPEAIECALASVHRDPDTSVWLVTDAYPHGWFAYGDFFPSGCPCGKRANYRGIKVLHTCGEIYSCEISNLYRDRGAIVKCMEKDALKSVLTSEDPFKNEEIERWGAEGARMREDMISQKEFEAAFLRVDKLSLTLPKSR